MSKKILVLLFSFFWIGCGDEETHLRCDEYLACDRGYIQVDSCQDPAECVEKTSGCGLGSLMCEPDPTCESIAPLECDEGYSRSDVCTKLGDRDCIQMINDCELFYCNPEPPASCLAEPSCQQNELAVETCRLTDSECADTTVCGKTISCTPSMDCRALPTCEADEIEYATKIECENDNENCRQTYACSSVVWCGGNSSCRAPDCGEKKAARDCEDPEKCEEVIGCGRRAICEK